MPSYKVVIRTDVPAFASVIIEAATQEEAENTALEAAPSIDGFETEWGGNEEYEIAYTELNDEEKKDD